MALRNVSVEFDGVVALKDVNVEFEGPGITAVVGPNGSGKSTAMGVLTGMIKPTRGDVDLYGRRMTGRTSLAFSRNGVRRSFQQVKLIRNITIWENILVGVQRPSKQAISDAQELVEAFRLGDYLSRWPNEVPAGVQRLVQVASVLVARPSVVVLDEPAAGLTDQEASELAESVRIAGQTALTIVVEHNMNFIYSLAERVVVLLTGRLAVDGDVEAVRTHPEFQEAYLGLAPEPAVSVTEEAEATWPRS